MQKEPLAESLHICKSFGEKWLALWKKKKEGKMGRWGLGGEREGEERLAESSAFMELPGTP